MTQKNKAYLERISQIRKLKKMSQADVAAWLNLDPTSYGKIENGKTALTVDRAYQLANIFEVSISELLDVSNEEFHKSIRDSLRPQVSEENAPYGKSSGLSIHLNFSDEGNSPEIENLLRQIGKMLNHPDRNIYLDRDGDEPGQ